MADLITTLGNRDRILIDDFSIAEDTTYSSQKIEDLIKTFDSVATCSIPLVEPVGTEGTYDTAYLTLLAGEIGERVLVTAQNGLGVVTAENGTAYTIKTVYVCTWEALTGKPFEAISSSDFTVDNGELRYVDQWTAPIAAVEAAKQDKVPESGSSGTGRYLGKRDPVSGDAVWEELDEFSLVNSVNGVFPENMPFGKNVQLDGTKINVDDTAGTPIPIKDVLINIADLSSSTLTDEAASNTLPNTGLISAILQTSRNCLKWLVGRFDSSGNANSAAKLSAARSLAVDLSKTAATPLTTFDGASAQEGIRVTGTLPVANGGSGRTDGKATALVTPRTLGGDDNAVGTVNFDGSANAAIPIPVTAAAPAASTAQTIAGTRSLRAQIKLLVDNIAALFSYFTATTDSTNTTTGALTVAGGVGIAKKLWVGDKINGTTGNFTGVVTVPTPPYPTI